MRTCKVIRWQRLKQGVWCDDDDVEDKSQRVRTDDLVTIYGIWHEGKIVYTGRTAGTPEKRLRQHGSRTSQCRLIRNAIRRHGISNFTIRPIVRCTAADADANESYYIMANKTMYPDGFNLRHGATAGVVAPESALMPLSLVSFESASDELRARAEAELDVADLCVDLEDTPSDICRELLREVHPDKAGERSYSAAEVSQMLNAVRDSLR